MTADQVRATVGEPGEVRPMKSSGAEIWSYRRRTTVGVDLVATGTQDVPYMDPLTGQLRSTPNAVYSQESHIVEQTLQLLMYNGKLESWKASARQERRYDR